MEDSQSSAKSEKALMIVMAGALVGYAISASPLFETPQIAGEMARSAASPSQDEQPEEPEPTPHADEGQGEGSEEPADHEPAHEADVHSHPGYWTVIPFVLLLGAIAILPLIPATEHWWESNLNRFKVAATLGALTLLYYGLVYDHPMHGHWLGNAATTGPQYAMTVFVDAIPGEYIPFIMLLFSLYTISGGIRIEGDLKAHPLTNSAIIAVGGLLASFVGTTGAAMLLIRLLLETNSERKHVKHTVVFFIFVVCNCGGCLLPIGDPPLFLGYLRGVPFLWTLALWMPWLFVNVCLIGIYYVYDRFWYYPHERLLDIALDETRTRRLRILGLWPNGLLLLGVVFSVALLDPTKELLRTGWYPWLYLREMAQLALIVLSLLLGSRAIRRANNFNYHAILEVAVLFFGIFLCMQPALQILNVKGPALGLNTQMEFFWLTGGLSSVLDNAPTYVVFFETAKTLELAPGATVVAGVETSLLVSISLGAVFMGAMTYIGNGPNFMVKAIAEKSGIKMPSFFGYMAYSCCVLLPLLAVTTVLFFLVLA